MQLKCLIFFDLRFTVKRRVRSGLSGIIVPDPGLAEPDNLMGTISKRAVCLFNRQKKVSLT